MTEPRIRKTFSYGFITGCTGILILAAAGAVGYGMRNYVRTLPRPVPPHGENPGGLGKEKGVPPGDPQVPPSAHDPGSGKPESGGTGQTPPGSKGAATGLQIEALAPQIEPLGEGAFRVVLPVRATGFQERDDGGSYGHDLALDVESVDPAGSVAEDLSGKDSVQFWESTPERMASLPLEVKVTIPVGRELGPWRFRVTVRDRIGGTSATAEYAALLSEAPPGK